MGGYGSGKRYSFATKRTTSGLIALDVNYLNRSGNLNQMCWSHINWSRGGQAMLSIRTHIEEAFLLLNYEWHSSHDKLETVTEHVLLSYTPCNYGGQRPWFICPGVINGVPCQRRVAKLYMAGKYFLCRRCYNLVYQSQRESKPDRLLRKSQNIRMRLGGTGSIMESFPFKPKGMHWSTYERLRCEEEDAEGHYLRKLDAWLIGLK